MENQTFDIPFRTPSALSDFTCPDGEIASTRNVSTFPDTILPAVTVPPQPKVTFGLVRDVLHGWHAAPDMYPSKSLSGRDPSMEYWNALVPGLLSQFCNDAAKQDLFVSPFNAVAAWRTHGGNYLSPSSPVSLIPNSEAPLIATDGDISSSDIDFKVAGAVGSLYFRFTPDERLRNLSDVISSMEILVSEPTHFYDVDNPFLPSKRIATEAYGIFLDPATGIETRTRICSDTLPLGWRCNSYLRSPVKPLRYTPLASIPLSIVSGLTSWRKASDYVISPSGRIPVEISSIPSLPTKSEIISVMGKVDDLDRKIFIITRPVKLGSSSFKMVRQVRLRGNFSPASITFTAFGSRDMQTWHKIASLQGSALLLPASRFRFYRFEISGFLQSGQSLQGISLQ